MLSTKPRLYLDLDELEGELADKLLASARKEGILPMMICRSEGHDYQPPIDLASHEASEATCTVCGVTRCQDDTGQVRYVYRQYGQTQEDEGE